MPSEIEEWAKKSATALADNLNSFKELNKSAFVLGYTGESGKALVQELAKSNIFSKVVLFGRREVEFEDEERKSMEQRIVDFDKLDDFADQFSGLDVGFCCLGTTRGKAGKEGFVKVDHDYVINSAKLAKAGGCQHFHLVSSVGAKQNSWFLYPKIKGQVEEALKGLEFQRLTIYRPGLLMCNREESRPMEKVSQALMKPIASAWPTAGTMPVTTMALSMVTATVSASDRTSEVLDNKIIHTLAGTMEKRRAERAERREQKRLEKAEKKAASEAAAAAKAEADAKAKEEEKTDKEKGEEEEKKEGEEEKKDEEAKEEETKEEEAKEEEAKEEAKADEGGEEAAKTEGE